MYHLSGTTTEEQVTERIVYIAISLSHTIKRYRQHTVNHHHY